MAVILYFVVLFFICINGKRAFDHGLPEIKKESPDGQFYLLESRAQDLNWMKAEYLCQVRGDHLASLHSAYDGVTVGQLCKGNNKDSLSKKFRVTLSSRAKIFK